jgi:type I restriction enzyme S subunit
VDVTDVYEMDFDSDDRDLFLLKKGDLLICEGGEPGRAAVWQDELPECYYQKAIHRGRPLTNMATAEYLAHMLWFLANGGGLMDHITSATIAHLTSEKLKAIKIPLPPLALQKVFSDRLAAIERVRCIHQEASSNLDNLFSSLQDRAFQGTL